MGNTFVLSGLRDKRARLAGEIDQAQRAITQQREALATLDAVIRMFDATSNPELIPAIRPRSSRCLYFRHGERAWLCINALREAGKPVSVRWVADYCMEAKGLNPDQRVREQITEGIRQCLHRIAAKGLARKILEFPETWWELV
jgi:hypothetical protein